MTKKVIDLDPSRPSARAVLEHLLDNIDEIQNVVVMFIRKDGVQGMSRSYMDIADVCLLKEMLTHRIHEEIAEAMMEDED